MQDTRRFLHAVYRVGDLDGTLEYYKKNFGMKQIRYRDIPEVSRYPQLYLRCSVSQWPIVQKRHSLLIGQNILSNYGCSVG